MPDSQMTNEDGWDYGEEDEDGWPNMSNHPPDSLRKDNS